jgi:hypothetical protein
MSERTAFFLGLALTIITSLIGYAFSQRLWEVIDTIFIVNTFVICIQMYFELRRGDPVFGKVIQELKDRPDVSPTLLELLESVAATLSYKDPFLTQKTVLFLQQAQSMCNGLEKGILEIDLRPGGLFFRETDIAELANARLRATSCVDINTYWNGPPGTRILRKNRMKIEGGLKIDRIFVEDSLELPLLKEVVTRNKTIGVTTRIAQSSDIDKGLVRDFAIIDDGTIAVELMLENKLPTKAVFYVASVPDGKRKIDELEEVWKNLVFHAQLC